MVYHAGLRASKLGVKLAGLVMIQPYFGGERRTESEKESKEDAILPLRAFKDHGYHVIELFEPVQAEALLSVVREFVYASSTC